MNLRGMIGFIVVVGSVFLASCASKESKQVSGMEQVTKTQNSIADTDKKLEKAQSELTTFQSTLKELSGSLKDSVGSARNEAASALQRLSLRIEQAQIDLKTVREENRIVAQDLDRRLKNAADSTRDELRPAPAPQNPNYPTNSNYPTN